ncbi:MAG TPA: OmpA family protein [Polyangiaceae bacterium]
MKRCVIAIMALLMTVGCGYTETEWKAQLDKYNHLNSQFEAEKAAHAKTQAELDAEKKRVADLEQELKKLGFNLSTLSEQLQQTGTEKDQLASNVDQLKRALEEYRTRAEQLERIKKRFEMLRDKLNKLTQMGLKVEVRNNRMVIRLPGDVLFPSGSDKLKDEGIKVLKAVADVIRNDPQLVKRYFQVAGHTDNKPLQGGPFRDNWGLSLMRARGVLLYLIEPVASPETKPTSKPGAKPGVNEAAKPATLAKDDAAKEGGGGLDVSRLHAAGYGETDPVQPNTDDEKRAANRRVELVLLPDVEEMLDLRQLL